MNKVFIPEDEIYNACVVIQSSDILRVYDTIPRNNTSYSYRDYYINSDYIFKEGSGSWGNNYTTLPICIDDDLITNDFYYRVDFFKILIIFLVFNIFAIYLPIKIFSKIFRKGAL